MLAQHKQQVADLIRQALAGIGAPAAAVELERPKVQAHGDLACNVALQVAKALKKNPREVATAIVDALRVNPAASGLIDSAELAGPGFINLRLAAGAKQAVVRQVLHERDGFGTAATHAGRRVMVEFVSANPTGPLHVGHARQAALGDALANLLATQGWQVTREFYYNDAGVQIDTLARSVQLRVRQLQGASIDEEAVGYKGDYIADIAREFLARKTQTARDGAPVTASGNAEDLENIRRFAVAYLRHEQDLDLAAFGVRFDVFYLESSLYAEGKVQAAVQAMVDSGLTYEAEGALWLRTTQIGGTAGFGGPGQDDKDRVMRKSDGTFTYFVPDVAYHVTKFQRGFAKVINVQGSDHFGTVARVRAGLQAAGQALGVPVPAGFPDYLLHKMVRVMKGGEEVKMSKRTGTYVTLRDLIDWVGKDATRFFLASRRADTEFAFDVDLALSQSEDNPVYYLQYAHARICSVLAQAAERGLGLEEARAAGIDLSPLGAPRELALLQRLAAYPELLATATEELAPHQLCFYLKDLAADFHAFYNAERVLVDEAPTREARLALLLAARQVLRNGLALLGVGAPERM
ncbi:MAG: arginine--tRNA ligase [Burkholderiales bacterium]|nr:arginine--tRNA ligase [Burkholderiales bacterium]MCA3228877.1 arginine--tRNA ligase [Burkholderiales bacterium]